MFPVSNIPSYNRNIRAGTGGTTIGSLSFVLPNEIFQSELLNRWFHHVGMYQLLEVTWSIVSMALGWLVILLPPLIWQVEDGVRTCLFLEAVQAIFCFIGSGCLYMCFQIIIIARISNLYEEFGLKDQSFTSVKISVWLFCRSKLWLRWWLQRKR